MASGTPNPLLSPQREKAGSQTAAKYAYQYHWALYRALIEHGKQKEYAVFVELHEDVVLCDALNASTANFEFNQIKTNAKTYTTELLIKKQKKGKSPSVLGKMISGATGKPFSTSITQLNLVAVSGFKIKQKNPGVDLKVITSSDIEAAELDKIALAIKNEISVSPLPTNLQFVIPDLSDKNFQNDVIAEISKLIADLFPESRTSSTEIYRVLIDDLTRKGEVAYDFTKWEDLLKNKALTSITVTKVINQFTNIKDEAKIEAGFTNIASELGLNTLASASLKKPFDRYRQARIGNKSIAQLDTTKDIKAKIDANLPLANNDMAVLIDSVLASLNEKTKKNFPSDIDIKAAIICEIIIEDT